ncbi:MAG: DUF1259 domain-containing protein [Gammaproteobacteria bacterium]|nr:DUF1259 domain-containing protein [Gammaproteobacteria bacterium]
MLNQGQSRKTHTYCLAVLIALVSAATTIAYAQSTNLDTKSINGAAGKQTSVEDDGVVRIEWSRDDVPVTVDGMPLPPPAGLGSWAAFKAVPGGVMVMGDTVVFEDEITPAMDAAFAHGLEVTGLHNHFIFDRPPVYFMHVGGHGEGEAQLAKGVRAVWDAVKAVREENPTPTERFAGRVPEQTDEIYVAALKEILDAQPDIKNGVVKFSFGREAAMHGAPVGESMGLNTWAAFMGNSECAAVDGDFAMTVEEVQPVMHALRKAGIHIVALHNHMIGEAPPYFFLHYWGKGHPEALARGVRDALDSQR